MMHIKETTSGFFDVRHHNDTIIIIFSRSLYIYYKIVSQLIINCYKAYKNNNYHVVYLFHNYI